MASLSPRNMAAIASGKYTPQQLFECLSDIVRSGNNVAQQVNAEPVGRTPAPLPHSALSVVGGGGIVDVAMTKDTPAYQGEENFFDYSNDNGATWHTKATGPARNWRGNLGTGPFLIRSYASHPTSGSSEPIYADPVHTTGAEPPMQAGQGSGTGTMGYGELPYTTTLPPKRS